MNELFTIDAQARDEDLSQMDRHLLRMEKSKPLLDQIKTTIEAARADALPKSALAKACNYTLTLWNRLSRFLEYPELELSNNLWPPPRTATTRSFSRANSTARRTSATLTQHTISFGCLSIIPL